MLQLDDSKYYRESASDTSDSYYSLTKIATWKEPNLMLLLQGLLLHKLIIDTLLC